METKIKVKFKYSLMFNEKNKYCVYQYQNLDTKERIVCVGYDLPSISVPYEFTVEEVQHKTYGLQYKVLTYEERISSDKESIIEYLTSGLIRGIGKATAGRIYDKFGDNTMSIFENDIEKLLSVKGISQKTYKKIKCSYEEAHISKDVMQLLYPFGFSAKNIFRICKVIKQDPVSKIEANPYILCDIKGITFQMADAMSAKYGINKEDYRRILAAIKEALKINNVTGSVGMTREDLIKQIKHISSVYNDIFIWKSIMSAIKNGQISYRKKKIDNKILQYFYLSSIMQAEDKLAEHICRVSSQECKKIDTSKLILYINECCRKSNLLLDESQMLAVVRVFNNGLTILTGGPGTGKTTITKIIIMVQEMIKATSKIELLSPTGRAARNMTEHTNRASNTIHHRYSLGVHDDNSEYQEEIDPIEADLIIVDEFSMVDLMLALKLFSGIKSARVVIVGDENQLPSVGLGAVLRDMIGSGVFNVSVLEYTHRQNEDSVISENAANMQKGITTLKEGNDFHSTYFNGAEYASMDIYQKMDIMEEKMVEEYAHDYDNPNISSVVCLVPYKKYSCGTISLNKKIQDRVNPLNGRDEVKGYNEMVFRQGDIVMHLTNEEDVLNGDIGKVVGIRYENHNAILIVDYGDINGPTDYEYTRENIEALVLAYAITIHKSQGSEYDSVITCMSSFHKSFKRRNMLYTAITRGKKKVSNYFDSPETVADAIRNNQLEERHTFLKYLLRERMQSTPAKPADIQYEQLRLKI